MSPFKTSLFKLKRKNSRLTSSGNFSSQIKAITGFNPRREALYKLAFRHSSASLEHSGQKVNNERLEFLGDAILGALVADHLYRRYPEKEEGWLTNMRSKIVSRKQLNRIGQALSLEHLLVQNHTGATKAKSIYGDAFEALIGALYLDRGYEKTRQFIDARLLKDLVDLPALQRSVVSYKSALLEYAAKKKALIDFKLIAEEGKSHNRRYTVACIYAEEKAGEGQGSSKKKAEEQAAKIAYPKIVAEHGPS